MVHGQGRIKGCHRRQLFQGGIQIMMRSQKYKQTKRGKE